MNYISQQEPNQMWIKKVLMLVLADILIVLISYFMALLLRFDFVFSSIPEEYLMGYLWSMPFWIISTIVIFYICRLYHSMMLRSKDASAGFCNENIRNVF